MGNIFFENLQISDALMYKREQTYGVAPYTSSISSEPTNKSAWSVDEISLGDVTLFKRNYAKITIEIPSNYQSTVVQFFGSASRTLYSNITIYVPRGSTLTADWIDGNPLANYKIRIVYPNDTTKGYNITLCAASNYYIDDVLLTPISSFPSTITDDFRIYPSVSAISDFPSEDWSTVTFSGTYTTFRNITKDTSITTLFLPKNSTMSVSGDTLTITKSDDSSIVQVKAIPYSDTAEYDYTFGSWGTVPSTLTQDVTLTATSTRSAMTYMVTLTAGTGATFTTTTLNVEYGVPYSISDDRKTITINGIDYTCTVVSNLFPSSSVRDYDHYGWGVGGTSGTIKGNTTFTAEGQYKSIDDPFFDGWKVWLLGKSGEWTWHNITDDTSSDLMQLGSDDLASGTTISYNYTDRILTVNFVYKDGTTETKQYELIDSNGNRKYEFYSVQNQSTYIDIQQILPTSSSIAMGYGFGLFNFYSYPAQSYLIPDNPNA